MSADTPPEDAHQTPQDDLPVTQKEIFEITSGDFTRFLNEREKGGFGECTVCGTDKWGSITPIENGTVSLILGEMGKMLAGRYLPCVAISCENCGYVRMHSVTPIVKWKRNI